MICGSNDVICDFPRNMSFVGKLRDLFGIDFLISKVSNKQCFPQMRCFSKTQNGGQLHFVGMSVYYKQEFQTPCFVSNNELGDDLGIFIGMISHSATVPSEG